jgi:hypothetical protein
MLADLDKATQLDGLHIVKEASKMKAHTGHPRATGWEAARWWKSMLCAVRNEPKEKRPLRKMLNDTFCLRLLPKLHYLWPGESRLNNLSTDGFKILGERLP